MSGSKDSGESDILRKMNPMKLLDSGADFLSSAVRGAVKGIKQGPSVADRISGLMKKDEDRQSNEAQLDVYRISVAVEHFKGDANNASYKLTLFDKKSNTMLLATTRPWAKVDSVLTFVRGMCPKLDAPSPPSASGGRNPAVVAEERRKYIQAFTNAAVAHPTASKLTELRELTGVKDYEEGRQHDARMTREPSEAERRLRHVNTAGGGGSSSNNGDAQAAFSENGSIAISGSMAASFRGASGARADDGGSSSPGSPRSSDRRAAPSTAGPDSQSSSPQLAPTTQQARRSVQIDSSSDDDRAAVDSCFRVLDVDGIGRITRDLISEFTTALEKLVTPQVQNACFDEFDRDNGTFDKKAFAQVVAKMAQRSRVPLSRIAATFKEFKFAELYQTIGVVSSGGSAEDLDDRELRTLCFILRVSGVRLLTEKETEKMDIAMPVSLPDFCELMEALTAVMPVDEVLQALAKSRDRSKLLQLVNRYATRANPTLVRNLRDKIVRHGGGGTTAKCANCDQLARAKAAQDARVAELLAANEALQKKVDALSASLQERDDRLRDISDSTYAKAGIVTEINKKVEDLEKELAAAKVREDDLLTRLCQAEAALDFERDRSTAWTSNNSSDDDGDRGSDDGDAAIDAGNLYFLAPLHLGTSDRAPVVDLPGALVYTLPPSFHPLGLAMDLFLRTDGCEYLACRDADGRRSCAWTIDDGVLSCPWTSEARPVKLPRGKWVRLRCRFHWGQRRFDLELDEQIVAQQIPMRDDAVDGVATLDVFPRNDVILCYANMHFFR